jgi:hypothetical protein
VSAEPGTGLAFGAFDITQSDLAVTVEAGRVTYAGSYKLEVKKGGLFRN